ncbi:ABC transporter ATP-binding protein [Streptosporangium sp. NBC_01755]|uniref:ABC transporter ATP-binding protein n=1 Tax=unclassified Streptosporangium TaxID=2632669 RepID=UPI002DDA2D89|nr:MULTISPECIES: ABC transporter ATP-binding protein [unclassified Streptosporangium]WSA25692.1 ABC transporter ATP-binding protein [Streptosporangium sp. NBC_01810]WSD02918.1 ABC transporter ATP-binding protein [Streptosporangium sp. NBC_01755]
MTLSARLVVTRPRFHLDIELEVAAGEVVALLGPNGAGKTTALRALAGLTALSGGRISLDGEALHTLAAERRPIGVVFQDYLLFPHLSALENVAFGPRCRGTSRAEARRDAAVWLERVGLAEHAAMKPRQLSGGQAQRVALARALAVEPRLLLMDEPLAALDAHTRLEIRSQLRRHLADFGGATVLVTHDPLDAMVLADRLVVIENGVVVQHGTPAEVARRPRTDYVARLVGLNLYRGTAAGQQVAVGEVLFSVAEHLDGPAFVAFPPSAVALYRTRPDGSPRNLWQATIEGVERHGDSVRIHLDGLIAAAADVTPAAVADLDLTPGQRIWASVKATETHVYPF